MARIFVDTNLLVYADQPTSAHHPVARALLNMHEAQGNELWISRQVLREYFSVVTRPSLGDPARPVLSPSEAINAVECFLETFWIAEDGPDVTAILLALVASHGVAGRLIHDANIVATMMAYSISTLPTFNASDFRRFTPSITVAPTTPP
jgi:predicted nucleic acid-binding protein